MSRNANESLGICRFCFSDNNSVPMTSIYGNPVVKELPGIISRIVPFSVTRCEVKNVDFVCFECFSKLTMLDRFIRKAEKCNNILKTRIKQKKKNDYLLVNPADVTDNKKRRQILAYLESSTEYETKPIIKCEPDSLENSQESTVQMNSQETIRSVNQTYPHQPTIMFHQPTQQFPVYNQMYPTVFFPPASHGPQFFYPSNYATPLLSTAANYQTPVNLISNLMTPVPGNCHQPPGTPSLPTNDINNLPRQTPTSTIIKEPTTSDVKNRNQEEKESETVVPCSSPASSDYSMSGAQYSLDLNFCKECKIMLSPSTNLFDHCLAQHTKK